jgi:hypothetical protein
MRCGHLYAWQVRLLDVCTFGVVYRLVSHAVAAALRSLLSDWLLIVTQLEHQLRLGRLSLQVGGTCST